MKYAYEFFIIWYTCTRDRDGPPDCYLSINGVKYSLCVRIPIYRNSYFEKTDNKSSGNGKGWSSFLYKRLHKDWDNQSVDVIPSFAFPETVNVCEFQDYNSVPKGPIMQSIDIAVFWSNCYKCHLHNFHFCSHKHFRMSLSQS